MGAAADTVRGLGKMAGCLAVCVGVIAIIALVMWLLFNGLVVLGHVVGFIFENRMFIIAPILIWIVFKVAREIGRK